MPVPLDEYPVHQAPLSMRHVATSDRNAYDRCYVNAHDRSGELFVITGLGVYPNLGVTDAFLIGPRELDLGWMIYLHRWFDDIAASLGVEPMRHFMRVSDVVAGYERASRTTVSPSLRWYLFYAALRHGVIMYRIARRQIAFGESTMPPDPDDLVMHRRTLEAMIEGGYWSGFDDL